MHLYIQSLFICLLLLAFDAHAAKIVLDKNLSLQVQITQASAGDHLIIPDGQYSGNLLIDKPLTLSGSKQVTLDAQGKGNGILITASNVTLDGFRVVNWGDDLTEQNAGIYTEGQLTHLTLKNMFLAGDGFGMWLQNVQHSQILANTVEGNTQLRSADRGNGIQLTNVKHNLVANNDISKVRDGLYVINSQDNVLENNTLHELRYGIHYMYSYDNQIINNHAYSTRAGYAMMNSRNLEITGNTTKNSEDYGFLLNYIIQSNISNNIIKDVWTKPENKVLGRDGKGFFVYNSGYNTISHNIVERAEIGIHLTAGSEKTQVYGNSFIDNPVQVKYVSNKKQEWSREGSGNYWSNYLGWDMDNDLKGDVPFEPNDGIDQLLWQYPEMKILMSSPAILVLRWVQRQFPVLKAPGVKDSFPLMQAPEILDGESNNNTVSKLEGNDKLNVIVMNK
ncbi:nitrous oxide reductase family maturation protein NosD [Thalassotalea sp. M1531]|uniref:Nitrous oxide reductase family maturation protein NosD n=1 Tax=Thalassotalea algicola TaxID=2716224 RepID=A0A7Y0LBT8_9GAMM|nr:nitrous oxide reductase family maturation protein NosD [Thalassotalea algicola]NMP31644.1 nitrous oxide reductase family maturation protein NosD [Thalassotalea algicola]